MARSISAVLSLKDNMSATLRNVKREQGAFKKDTIKMRKELEKTWDKKRQAKLDATKATKKMNELKKKYADHRRKLVKVFAVKDLITRKMRKIKNSLKSFARRKFAPILAIRDRSKKVLKSVKKKLLGLGKIAGALAIGGGLIGIRGVTELDSGAAKVQTIAGSSLNQSEIKKSLLSASNKTGLSTKDLAEAQYSAISSGVSAKDSLKASMEASKLARAGFTDANSALKIMTSTMNVYGLTGVEAMKQISDKLLTTQNLGVTTVAELSHSMGTLTPIANSAGLSIDEMMAGMASLTKNGLKTSEAVSAYEGALTNVIKPTAEAQKMAKKLGIDFSVSAIKSKGFKKFLDEIKEKTGGSTEVMGKLFGDVRALSGMLVLTGKGNKDFASSLDAMKNSVGQTDKAFNIMNNTLGNRLRKLGNLGKNALTTIMGGSSESLEVITDSISNFLENNQEGLESFGEVVGNGVGTAIGSLFKFSGWISEHMPFVKRKIGSIASWFSEKFGWIGKETGFLKEVFSSLGRGLRTEFQGLWKVGRPVFDLIASSVKLLFYTFKWAFPGIRAIIGGVWKVVRPMLEKLGSAIGWVAEKAGKIAGWLGKKLDNREKSATGKVDGSHFNGLSYVPRDGYIARLHKGERVLTAQENRESNNVKTNYITININATGKSTGEIVDELVPALKLAIENV